MQWQDEVALHIQAGCLRCGEYDEHSSKLMAAPAGSNGSRGANNDESTLNRLAPRGTTRSGMHGALSIPTCLIPRNAQEGEEAGDADQDLGSEFNDAVPPITVMTCDPIYCCNLPIDPLIQAMAPTTLPRPHDGSPCLTSTSSSYPMSCLGATCTRAARRYLNSGSGGSCSTR